MIVLLMLVLAYGGMTALCLAMNRHYRQVRFGAPSPGLKLVLRIAGSLLLFVAFWLGIVGWGASIGPVVWFGALTVSALTLVFLLPYRPLLVLRSSVFVTPLALLTTAVVLFF